MSSSVIQCLALQNCRVVGVFYKKIRFVSSQSIYKKFVVSLHSTPDYLLHKMHILELQQINKNFNGHQALRDVSLNIPKGGIFGLLGPNGAGKTTLIRIITDILQPDSGTLYFDGKPATPQRVEQIGYMPEERGLYKSMKVGEQLLYLAKLRGVPAKRAAELVDAALRRLEIADWRNRKVDELSKGMQQKIQFIATILHEPRLIILDEPYSGLDPVNAQLISEEIFSLRDKGATIILSNHRMEQVEQICENIALIHHGKIVLEGAVEAVKERFKQHIYEIRWRKGGTWQRNAESDILPFFIEKELENGLILRLPETAASTQAVLQYFGRQENLDLVVFREILPSLHQIFVEQVKGKAT